MNDFKYHNIYLNYKVNIKFNNMTDII